MFGTDTDMNLHLCSIHGTFDYAEYGSYCPKCYPADHKDMSAWKTPAKPEKAAPAPLPGTQEAILDDPVAATLNHMATNRYKGG